MIETSGAKIREKFLKSKRPRGGGGERGAVLKVRVARFGLFEAKNDKFGLFYIGWPGHFLEFIKYLAFFKVYRRFNSKIKTFFLF